MRLGISASSINFSDNYESADGIGVYTRSLLTEMRRLGVRAEGYVFSETKSNEFKSLNASYCTRLLRDALPLSNAMQLPVDVFHVTDYKVVNMNCPVITTLHDTIPLEFPEFANNKFRNIKNFILRQSALKADHVITVSSYSAEKIIEYYKIPESKITVVHSGVDSFWNEPQKISNVQDAISDFYLNPGYFLTVGTLQPRKNILRILEAHDKLTHSQRVNHPLVVVGKRGWSCEDIIRRMREKNLKRECFWISNVYTREQLRSIYCGAEAFLFPSLYEGFGLPVLEAFATGLPVLTSSTTSLKEISNGIALEVDPLSVDAIAQGMSYLLNMYTRKEMIDAGKSRAAELSWERCALETINVYRKVMNG